ncbi:transcriptional regulatory [Fusarium tjaetaba]|uniref:Transcriptional regulatory n=1 Tax=Fusarium tjaetaba TaxID=1567544 RepID=A0A8H5RKX6_9HYPO|nr:transcriptional regulatory [Fusarium tjaetaba]KAF5633831.1 transcriptional regulatory [Fusarium tjaetaba]
MKTHRRKVTKACERCRKQKLKCDIERPCTLCSRANVECIKSESSRWRPYESTSRQAATTENSVRGQSGVTVGSVIESAWNSSSTVKLVEEAFQQHDASSPEGVEFSALRSETWARSKATTEDVPDDIVQPHIPERSRDIQLQRNDMKAAPSTAEKELMSLLPELEPATLLIDNYFDRIHWFILVFHQDDFRRKFQDLYNNSTVSSGPNAPSTGKGFLAVLLAVFVTSLHHIGTQESKLKSYNVDPRELEEMILASLKSRFLDVISKGSLEAVQFCVLLASYYLYHGEPGLAWPLSGSGLRIAQALDLHRKTTPEGHSGQALNEQIQDRKRAWWAVYEIDTFCSMLYGFPLGFSDSDCNVEALDPYDEYSKSTKESRQATGSTLLFYKFSMSKLSAIVKSALVDLYGTSHDNRKRTNNPKGLFDKVRALNESLQDWYRSLVPKLRFVGPDSLSEGQVSHDRERTGREFEDHLFRLQALSLKLAYENARIMIHRPLLSFRMARSAPTNTTTSETDQFRLARQECREAALQISNVASTPYLLEASETYAIAVVSLHLLTAGVTLCISMTLDPLIPSSAEARSGLRQLIQVQTFLKDKSIVAAQSLDITKRLMGLVMAKAGNNTLEAENLPGAYPELTQRDRMESQRTDLTGTSSGQTPMPPLAAIMNNGSITDTLSMDFADHDMDIYAKTSLNDTLLEYEQAASRVFAGDITYDPSDSILDNPFLEQNQGWIWSWNFLD